MHTTQTKSPKQQMLEADRRRMAAIIRRSRGRCEQCGAIRRFRFRACELCVPSL